MGMATYLKNIVMDDDFRFASMEVYLANKDAYNAREDEWVRKFFSYFVFKDESEAIEHFLYLGRLTGIWGIHEGMPHVVRASLIRSGSYLPIYLEVMCRIEELIRDHFRAQKRNNG